MLRYHFCRPNKQSWGKKQGCFGHRVRCGKREVKDTGKSSLAGKQSTSNSRKSLRAYKVISNSHKAAQLTALLFCKTRKQCWLLGLVWTGWSGKERGTRGSLGSLGQSSAKHQAVVSSLVYLGKHTEWHLGDYVNSSP